MKLKEYLENINELVKADPNILDYTVVFSSDDEGNSYNEVHYEPSLGIYEDDEWVGVEYDSYENYDEKDINAICIN